MRAFAWVLGPTSALLLLGLTVLGNAGPGFFILAIVAAGCLGLGLPLLMLGLRRTERFADKPMLALCTALTVVLLLLIAISALAVFNQR